MRYHLLAVVFAMALWAVSPARSADKPDDFPARQLQIIVPFAQGGGLDVATRVLARHAEPELGQSIVIVNKTQGGNIQGNLDAMRADPDGYTLGAWGSGLATDELLIRNVPYAHTDVQPICVFANDPGIITVGRQFADEHGIATLEDLVGHVRDNPGLVTMGMGGNWTTHDFLRVKLEGAAGIKFNRMPFLGGALAIRATAEGNCNVATPFMSELLPWLESDRVVPLAVAYNQRLPQIPDVPTTAEAGFPGLTQSIWRVLTVPKGTPEEVVRRLESVFRKASHSREYLAEARELGVNPMFGGVEYTERFVQYEYEYYLLKTEEWGIRVNK